MPIGLITKTTASLAIALGLLGGMLLPTTAQAAPIPIEKCGSEHAHIAVVEPFGVAGVDSFSCNYQARVTDSTTIAFSGVSTWPFTWARAHIKKPNGNVHCITGGQAH